MFVIVDRKLKEVIVWNPDYVCWLSDRDRKLPQLISIFLEKANEAPSGRTVESRITEGFTEAECTHTERAILECDPSSRRVRRLQKLTYENER